MKKKAFSAIVLIAALATACNSDKKSIEKVAYGYLNATGNYLIEEAKPYANTETREKTLPFLSNTLIPLTPKEYIQSNTPATIVINNIDIAGDTAMVAYTKTTPIKVLEGEIHVVREKGEWLVYVPLVLPQNLLSGGDTVISTLTPIEKK
ncbi:MAG: hypothetical protein MJZ99_02940 [Bacteroidales bacterium]|nr:hypothetical protein [Candidatus Colimorpha merdihippi]MCQ2281564.1 hypothetical protein [Bacteroidales bacterium]